MNCNIARDIGAAVASIIFNPWYSRGKWPDRRSLLYGFLLGLVVGLLL